MSVPAAETADAEAMAGTRLVLVRHAQSVSNAESVIGGHHGCTGLSELGTRQATALAGRLAATGELAGTTALFTSVLPRAVETATIVGAALGAGDAVQTCDLCEQHPGEADGMTWAEYVRTYGRYSGRSEPDRRLAPGGESWTELLARASATLAGIAARHAGELVVIVTHGGVIDASLVDFLRLPDVGAGVAFRTWNASMTEWRHTGRRWALVHYNDTAHLSAAGVPTSD